MPISLRQVLGRLTLTNALNGLGYGFMGPLLVYWFHVRFGVSSGVLGTLYFMINLLTVASYLGAARMVRGLGAVNAVVASRAAGIVALLAMALVSSFDLAAALLAARTLFNSLSKPARDSYMMGVAEEGRRSIVAGVSQLPGQVSSSISPAVGAALMPVFQEIPIVGAAFFQTLNVLTYYLAFRRVAERDELACGLDGGEATLDTMRAAIDCAQAPSGTGALVAPRPAPRAASDVERDIAPSSDNQRKGRTERMA